MFLISFSDVQVDVHQKSISELSGGSGLSPCHSIKSVSSLGSTGEVENRLYAF